MAAAIPFMMVASAAISAYGAIQQGRAAEAAGKYNAAIANQNAIMARQDAQTQAEQQARVNYMRLGSIRAAAGASGIKAEGSVLDVIGDVVSQGELEKQNIIYQGELKARGLESTAALDRAQGRNARNASYLQAGSSLLGGATSLYSNAPKTQQTIPVGLRRIQ